MHSDEIWPKLRDYANSGKPIWGTCAGCILLSEHVSSSLGGGVSEGNVSLSSVKGESLYGDHHIGGIDINTCRNFFGRQTKSFETQSVSQEPAFSGYPSVFIRAPAIVKVGNSAQTLATINYNDEDVIVAARQRNLLATCFHPELTNDLRVHKYFLDIVNSRSS